MRESYPVVVIDNVSYELDSPPLCKLLTATEWGDRILGHSRTVRLPVRSVWIANGNNIKPAGDLHRRCYWIKLDARMAEPWKRTGFEQPNLKAHVLRHRGELVAAFLTLARAWYAAGCPPPKITPIGSFEDWTTVVGGILEHAHLHGFLQNADVHADEDAQVWEHFLLTLRQNFGANAFTIADVCRRCSDTSSSLYQALPDIGLDSGEGSFQRRLGKALASRAARPFGKSGVYLERAGVHHGAVRWRVKAAG